MSTLATHSTESKSFSEPAFPYEATSEGFVWLKPTDKGTVRVALTNFTAEIVADILEDDGVETHRFLEIEAQLNGQTTRFRIPALQFDRMNWSTEYLGSGAILYANANSEKHTKVAIQLYSSSKEHIIYTHTGWRKTIDGEWIYLHAYGAIGTVGTFSDIGVRLPENLVRYALPDPPTGKNLKNVVNASLNILDVASDEISYPLYASIWRAALGGTQFSLHASGRTGTFKSSLAALVQQHFGADMDSAHLPGSWSGTANSLEMICFRAKDTIIVVDDFCPTGSRTDIDRYHKTADQLMRAQGNQAGRSRLTSDSELKPVKPPRGLILSTGEDTPRGHSLRARLLEIEVQPGQIMQPQLTTCQHQAAQGLYAQALAGFVHWLAPRYEHIHKGLAEEIAQLRKQASHLKAHPRTPDIIANLGIGFKYFLEFAQDVGATTKNQADRLWAQGWQSLLLVGKSQRDIQEDMDPVLQVFDLLEVAVTSGQSHLVTIKGNQPEHPQEWGWKEFGCEDWRPQGTKIGWIDQTKQAFYLDPNKALSIAQQQAKKQQETLAFTEQTIKRRMKDGKYLQTDRNRVTVRRLIERRRREVLFLSNSTPFSQKLR